MRKQGIGSRTPLQDRREVEARATLRESPADIHRAMDGRVSLPTIRGIWNAINPNDESGPWTLADAETPEDARLILGLQRWVREWSRGRVRHLTRREATIAVRASWVAPGMGGGPLYVFVREYVRRQEAREPVDDMDIQLAYIGDQKGWDRAVARGWVEPMGDSERSIWEEIVRLNDVEG
jgi:hypothetical protein